MGTKNKKKLLIMILPVLLVIFCVYLFTSYKNYSRVKGYNQAKEYVLDVFGQYIDKNLIEPNYQTNLYELNGNIYMGRIYIVNNSQDVNFVKNILEKCEPLFKVYLYAPTNVHVYICGIDIGCTNTRGHYFLRNEKSNSYGFTLPEEYNNKLWDFLESLEYKEATFET
jgi:hypothetical protein